MLQLTYIREHEQEVVERLAVKHFDGKEIIRQIIVLDDKRRETQKQLDDLQAKSNTIAREIGVLFQSGKAGEANRKKEETVQLKNESKELGIMLEQTKSSLDELLVRIPNLPHASVPPGRSAKNNLIVASWGEAVKEPKGFVPHWDLIAK